MLTVIHTVGSLAEADGGPARSIPGLVRALRRQGVDVVLITANRGPAITGEGPSECVVSTPRREGSRRWLASTVAFPTRLTRLCRAAGAPLVVHDHGVWMPNNVLAALVARRTGAKLVVSPRGMLSPWALRHRSRRKRVAWVAYQRWLLRCADLVHATSELEATELRALNLKTPICVLPNGVEQPPTAVLPIERPRRILFLSRIHPKKGLSSLVRAFAQCDWRGWGLVIGGDGDRALVEEAQALAATLGIGESVLYAGAIPEAAKWEFLARGQVFALPSYSENFGMAIAEALAAGLPVVTTRATPWQVLESTGSGWWIEPTVEGVKAGLQAAMSLSPAELSEMGMRGRSMVEAEFAWPVIGRKMAATYGWLVGRAECPSWVWHADGV